MAFADNIGCSWIADKMVIISKCLSSNKNFGAQSENCNCCSKSSASASTFSSGASSAGTYSGGLMWFPKPRPSDNFFRNNISTNFLIEIIILFAKLHKIK